MRRSIATVSLSGGLEDKLRAAAAAGFSGVEIFENDLIASPLPPREVRALTESLGLRIDLYQPFRDFEGVDDARLERNLRRAVAKFEVMTELGVDTVLVCSNVAPSTIDDDARAAAQLRRLAELAEEHGVRIAYEALAWGRRVNDYAHSWRLVAEADHPALGVCLDSFHILSVGDDPAGFREIPGEKIFFLQLADAPRMAMDVLQWSRHYRCFPGQGGFDLTTFTRHVVEAGYSGPLSLEVFNDVFRASDPYRTAADALRSLSVLEDAVARSTETAGTGVAAPPRRAVTLTRLPDPVRPTGYGFVEVAATRTSADRIRRVLTALGFEHTRDHRSKPVQLWSHGSTRILLSSTDARLGHTWSADATATALGIAVADPHHAVRRAEELLAPALPRRRDPTESPLQAVAAPDGTAVFFCPADDTRGTDWLEDFSTAAVADHQDGVNTPITGIDHVGLFQPFDHFDEASLFYRSVLGLEPAESLELAAPDGLVRSRALTTANGSVRIALNVSVLGRGAQADAAGGAQHIALASDDIVASARAMTEAGVAPLPIPDNYYADLRSRTDLDEETLERLRVHGIMYDQVGDGEFFHFYTPMVDGRLFFEVVQRRGGYDGYGAANSPFRMAAQRVERVQ
ncbi:sugar phosphate isomerase/epimerase and 4-hydroxyphenylpyruvate domain-containing protein [Spiractinospora alimapuensis]|uniref:bifunctional sugar phosphate isomerase/epimerase/4-hydroxyphenylpyruvate dioxygenase family protein n=1 Tax=Spiractinospora alimapuensis TaxID=2820884 RepID=UPI001F35F3CA|nr:sugar phosphate isomerase/epimerase and 4-hydroxyphenylpyruvate domain-containing protein [Spiractinospora alimapuensis]QVQ52363.1 sugar phosphate isomerase/epimerase and 4-hydroxyphenylpyruvate domain-containing protein [Spiractinospora alimapuensis]